MGLYRAFQVLRGTSLQIGDIKAEEGEWLVREKDTNDIFGVFDPDTFLRLFSPVAGEFILDVKQPQYMPIDIPDGMPLETFGRIVQDEINKAARKWGTREQEK